MLKVFYITPIIKTIADNGSEKLGAQAITKMWTDENPNMKMEVTVSGKTKEESKTKLLNFLSSGGENEIIELDSEPLKLIEYEQ
jgi:hypothetical protein